jgi:TPR repeat protein
VARASRLVVAVAAVLLTGSGAIAALSIVRVAREPWRTGGLAAAAFHRGDGLARLELEILAALGVTEADEAIAAAMLAGRAGPPARALPYLRRAAEAGSRSARLALGKALVQGQGGLARDPVEARRWLEAGARDGDAAAAYWLAVLLRSREGGRDFAAAIPWLEQAAAAGLSSAHFVLGNAYRDGEGVPADPRRALAEWEAAAEDEDPSALQALAQTWREGGMGITPDPAKAGGYMAELAHAVMHPIRSP